MVISPKDNVQKVVLGLKQEGGVRRRAQAERKKQKDEDMQEPNHWKVDTWYVGEWGVHEAG